MTAEISKAHLVETGLGKFNSQRTLRGGGNTASKLQNKAGWMDAKVGTKRDGKEPDFPSSYNRQEAMVGSIVTLVLK